MSEQTYIGGELELFAHARHWKRYWSSTVRRHIHGAVLEVGAGLGANTLMLRSGTERRWLCLEPDPKLVAALRKRIASHPNGQACEVRAGTMAALAPGEMFDTILYIDVLEHIADDRDELERAANHLSPSGGLIVLAPAHAWLFTEFDQAIGHHRRYTARTLSALTPSRLRLVRSFYLDSVGLFASAANRWILRQSMPTTKQLSFWDGFMVPCSRVLDPMTGHRLGKSVICVWERKA